MRPALLVVPLALAGCSLGLGGLGPGEESSTDAGTSSGASPDASQPLQYDAQATGTVDASGGPCVASIPSGWSLVVYEQSRAACPSSFPPHDLVGSPQAAPAACKCSCTVTGQPTCETGTLQGGFDPAGRTGACTTTVAPLSLADGTCTQLQPGGPVPAAIAIDPLPASGGSCAGAAVGDTSQVTTSEVRTCDVSGGGMESLCAGAAPAGFVTCITSPGDVACPTSSVFSSKTVLAASETLVCTACSTCTVAGTCTNGTVTFYADYLCLNPAASFPADGTCRQPSWTGTIAGVEYHAQTQATCSADGSMATFEAVSAQTLCCR